MLLKSRNNLRRLGVDIPRNLHDTRTISAAANEHARTRHGTQTGARGATATPTRARDEPRSSAPRRSRTAPTPRLPQSKPRLHSTREQADANKSAQHNVWPLPPRTKLHKTQRFDHALASLFSLSLFDNLLYDFLDNFLLSNLFLHDVPLLFLWAAIHRLAVV